MQIKVLFFASFKQHLNCDQLSLEVSTGDTVEVICESLAQRGPEWLELFGNSKSKVKVSINQEMANFQDVLSDGDEIAFFPPVTGG